MKVLYPDNETRLTTQDFATPLTLLLDALLDGDTRVKEFASDGFIVKGYWIMPADGRGSPVLRIDCKMVGMIVEGPVSVEKRDELEKGIRSQGL